MQTQGVRRKCFVSTPEIIALYCDGGVIKRNPSHIGGTWAFCGINAEGERVLSRGGVVPANGKPVTNNHTEQIAITLALEAMPDGWSGVVYSDSQIALGRVFKGWSTKNLPRNISERSKAALRRLGKVRYVHLKGHPTKEELRNGVDNRFGCPVSIFNVWCDAECSRQSRAYLSKLGIFH